MSWTWYREPGSFTVRTWIRAHVVRFERFGPLSKKEHYLSAKSWPISWSNSFDFYWLYTKSLIHRAWPSSSFELFCFIWFRFVLFPVCLFACILPHILVFHPRLTKGCLQNPREFFPCLLKIKKKVTKAF